MYNIKKINISKLHGHRDYCITIKNNKLILVGENGSGKTTILRMVFYLLSKQWRKLIDIDFEEISVQIDNTTVKFNKNSFLTELDKLSGYPTRLRSIFLEDKEEFISYMTRHVPDRVMKDILDNNYTTPIEKALEKLNLSVLYLPTYRRIEQEHQYIFGDSDPREETSFRASKYEKRITRSENFIEQVEFGMNDVSRAIENKISSIKEYSRNSLNELSMGYLGDIIDKEYNNLDLSEIKDIDDKKIKNVLDRIDEKILPKTRKNKIERTIHNVKNSSSQNTEDKVVCYYFIKLLKFNSELEQKEKELQTFCNVCNSYFYDKEIIYSKDISVDILNKNKKNITGTSLNKILNTLSSGEKQVVSIFSKLYLRDTDRKEKFLVLIDEPELSLSVPWQKKLIPDMEKGNYCGGIIAVTHSPFIYDNPSIDSYAHSLEEFKK